MSDSSAAVGPSPAPPPRRRDYDTSIPRRGVLLTKTLVRDVVSRPFWRRKRSGQIAPGSLDAAIDWLMATHDVTGRAGSSQGFHLLRGWRPAFPETTGYVIGTLLAYSLRRDMPEAAVHARQMGAWEIEVQATDGGIMEGIIGGRGRSIAFNTGMVLHGWVDLFRYTGDDRYLHAARRAGQFLLSNQDPDGAWRGHASYMGLATTYHTRVAWAMLRLADVLGSDQLSSAAIKNLEWALDQQRANGWFDRCNFKPNRLPNTHGIAYTLRGLLEAGLLLDDDRYIEPVRLASHHLIGKLETQGTLYANVDPEWGAASRYVCLTGLVQLGDIWRKLGVIDSDPRYLNAGLRAIAQALTRQERRPGAANGALPGSFPITGLYAPLLFPNWATKFLADALMTLEEQE